MARGLDADPATEVHVDVPVRVLDEGTFRERDVDGKGDLHRVRDKLLLPRHRSFRLRSRRDRNDLRSTELLLRAFRHVTLLVPGPLRLGPAERDGTKKIIAFYCNGGGTAWPPHEVRL